MSVAESGGRIVGTAIYFVSFSTWTGRHGLYLEDLVVNDAPFVDGGEDDLSTLR
jgi:hypothetical protein